MSNLLAIRSILCDFYVTPPHLRNSDPEKFELIIKLM